MIDIEEEIMHLNNHSVIYEGAADSQMFAKDRGDQENSVIELFEPLEFEPSAKGPGSRVQGLEMVREYLHGAIPDKYGMREYPGMFVFNTCKNWIRTVPTLSRDEKNPEDVDTEQEDHSFDVSKYFCLTIMKGKSAEMFNF